MQRTWTGVALLYLGKCEDSFLALLGVQLLVMDLTPRGTGIVTLSDFVRVTSELCVSSLFCLILFGSYKMRVNMPGGSIALRVALPNARQVA